MNAWLTKDVLVFDKIARADSGASHHIMCG